MFIRSIADRFRHDAFQTYDDRLLTNSINMTYSRTTIIRMLYYVNNISTILLYINSAKLIIMIQFENRDPFVLVSLILLKKKEEVIH